MVVVALSFATGGWLLQKGVDRSENVYMKVRLLQEVMDRVRSSYVDSVDTGKLYDAAIDGLVKDLHDPYSVFMPASQFEDLRIQTEGNYGGVGLEVIKRNGHVTVVSPIPGTPGARAGIRSGDEFYAVNDTVVADYSTNAIVDLLRGEPGTEVHVKMLRPGVDQPIPFTLKRASIKLKAVPFAMMLPDSVGYVPFQTVRETSAQEIRAAVDSLKGLGLKGLVFDLRGNPGGLLDQGVAVSDLFLDKGDSIVETRGRDPTQDQAYLAKTADRYPHLPVVVLVNGFSASAAEIVSGALQDNDRAVLVGERTYGKGVVQSLYQLSGGNVLKLTTARWYTPVGRCIQKSDSVRNAEETADHALTLDGQPVERKDLANRPTYTSVGGRTLYGGGGITPDIWVAPDTLTAAEEVAVKGLYSQAGQFSVALFNYAVRYVQEHPGLKVGFSLSDADLQQFYKALPTWKVHVRHSDFEGAKRFVRYNLEREIALQAWGQEGQFRETMGMDRPLERAIALLRGAPDTPSLLKEAKSQPAGAAPSS